MRDFATRLAALLVFALPLLAAAQSPPVRWTRSLDPGTGNTWLAGAGEFYSDQRAAAVDAAGNLFVASSRFDGSTFIWVTTKFDAATGVTLWQKTYSEAGAGPHYARGLAVDAAGDVVVTGEVEISDVSNMTTIKYAGADGALVWQKGPEVGLAGKAVAIDAAGNAIVTGGNFFFGNITTTKRAAADGAVLWEKYFSGNAGSVPEALALDASGNAILAGTSFGTDEDFLVIKYAAADGAIAWQKTFDSTGSDYATSLAIDAAGNAIVTGVSSIALDNNFRTIKFAAADGTIVWNKTFDGGFQDEPFSVAVDAAGNAAVGGYAYDPLDLDRDLKVIVYAAADGAIIHDITFNGLGDVDDIAQAVAMDASGNILAVGASSANIIARKYSGATGAFQWAYTNAGLGWSARGVVAIATSSALYIAGNVDDVPNSTTYLRVAKVGLDLAPTSVARDLSGDGKSDVLLRGPSGEVVAWLMNGDLIASSTLMLGGGSGFQATQFGDFNGDGKQDLLVAGATGELVIWLMDGDTVASSALVLSGGSGYAVDKLGDFNGDGKSDIVFKGAAGDLVVWLMDGATVTGNAVVLGTGTGFSPVAIGDFDNDGKDDVVISHTDGRITMWLMNGTAIASSQNLLGAGTGYTISHVGEFNADSKDDLMLKGPAGEIVMWQMDGLTIANSVLLYGGGPWQITHIADVNGDGKDDMVLKGPSGEIVIWEMNGSTITNSTLMYGGGGWIVTHVGDYNGDGKSDLLLKGPGGEIVVWIMNGSTITSATLLVGATTWHATP